MSNQTSLPSEQANKFKEAAREIGADEDEARWEDRLRKVVKHKPATDEPTDS